MTIDVEADPQISPHVIADAAAIGVDVIDALGRGHRRAGAVAVLEAVCADPANGVNRPVDLLADGAGRPRQQVYGWLTSYEYCTSRVTVRVSLVLSNGTYARSTAAVAPWKLGTAGESGWKSR